MRAAVALVRESVGALLRISPSAVEGQFQLGIVGTAWCVSANFAFVTAHHAFNDGGTRDPAFAFGPGRLGQKAPPYAEPKDPPT